MPALIDRDFPDPCVRRFGQALHAYATNTDSPLLGHVHVQHARSRDHGATWDYTGDVLPYPGRYADGANVWAPEVFAVGDRYAMLYAAPDKRDGRFALWLALAWHADGPFRPVDLYLRKHEKLGSIDPFVFTDDGRTYLIWKDCGEEAWTLTPIWLQELDTREWCLVGERTLLAVNDSAWEGPCVEAPLLLKRDGYYHLLYSGHQWSTAFYGIGHAVSRDLRGPYRKTGKLLVAPGQVEGPGGQDVLLEGRGGGTFLLYYHGWEPSRVGYEQGGRRALYAAPLRFDGESCVVGSGKSRADEPAPFHRSWRWGMPR